MKCSFIPQVFYIFSVSSLISCLSQWYVHFICSVKFIIKIYTLCHNSLLSIKCKNLEWFPPFSFLIMMIVLPLFLFMLNLARSILMYEYCQKVQHWTSLFSQLYVYLLFHRFLALPLLFPSFLSFVFMFSYFYVFWDESLKLIFKLSYLLLFKARNIKSTFLRWKLENLIFKLSYWLIFTAINFSKPFFIVSLSSLSLSLSLPPTIPQFSIHHALSNPRRIKE